MKDLDVNKVIEKLTELESQDFDLRSVSLIFSIVFGLENNKN